MKAKDLTSLQTEFQTQIAAVDPAILFTNFKNTLLQGIVNGDLHQVLATFDNKGLLGLAATALGVRDGKTLLEKIGHLLGGISGADLKRELKGALPTIAP